MKRIGMIVAMTKELNEYFSKLGKVEKLENELFDIWQANVYGKELYIVQSGVGEIAAAIATQYLITKYSVNVVVNFGVCGKLNGNLKILDTVIVKSVIHYQFDTSAIDETGPGVYMNNSAYISADNRLIDQLLSIDSNLKCVVCASGDKFISAKEDKDYLVNLFSADICEMESAGVLITCIKNNVGCLLVKSVSDDCDDMDFNTYCVLAAKQYVELIDKFVKEY